MQKCHPSAQTQGCRCHSLLYRTAIYTFAGRIILEDDHPCRVQAALRDNRRLQVDLYSLTSLDWGRSILGPAGEPDFVGQLSLWDNRLYQAGVSIRHGLRLQLEISLRPLHLHHHHALKLEVIR